MHKPTVLQTRQFSTQQQAAGWLAQLSAQYRRNDDVTGAPLYKTPAGVVLRLAGPTVVEVLSNCAC